MEVVRDAEYCADVKDLVAEAAARQAFSYVSNNVRFMLLLPSTIYVDRLIGGEDVALFAVRVSYAVKVLLDEQKKGIAVMLEAPNYIVTLVYEREGPERKPTLKKTIFANRELSALLNGPLTSQQGRKSS